MRKIYLTFLFWLLTLSVAHAVTYYVRQGCTNNITTYNAAANTCTGGTDRVYSTINNALSGGLLVAGSILDIRAGTYAEAILSSNGNVPLGGTDWGSGALTIQGHPGETVRLQPTTSSAVVALSGTGTGTSRSYFIFKNLIIDGLNANSQPFGDVVGLGGGGNGIVDHIKFESVEIVGRVATSSPNADFNCFHPSTQSNFIWIINSTIHQCGISPITATGNIGHGVYAETENLIMDNVEIYNVQGFGIQNYSGVGNNNVYRNLKIHDVCLNLSRGCTAFLLLTGTNSVGYNLQIYRSAQQAVGIRGDGHKVFSSTIYNNNTGCASSANGCNPVVQIDGGIGPVFQNNIVVGNVSNSISTAGSTSPTVDHNVTTGTPTAMFVDPVNDNFHLLAGASTLINLGATLGAPYNVDYGGVVRPQGAAYDIGAYEFSSGTSIVVAVTGASPACSPPACTVASGTLSLSGTTTAVSAGAVTFVNNRGGSGAASWSPGSGWTISAIALKSGVNNITITSTDAASNAGATSIAVTYAPTFPGDALILALGLEDGSGTTATDSSGLTNTGTLVNGPTWVTTGRFGKALSLNGINQYIDVNDSNSLRLTQSFTLSAWVQPAASLATFKAVIYKDGGSLSSPYSLYGVSASFGGCTAGGYVGIAHVNGTSGPDYSACSSLPLQTGVWTHIAVTYDNVTAQLKLYRMGVLVTTVSASGYMEPSTVTTPLDLRIGGSEFGENWQGLIDEVRVYNKALPITAASNTVAGASCTSVNFTDNNAVATASIVGNMNCPIINLTPPSQFKLSAGATQLKLGSSATAAKVGANP